MSRGGRNYFILPFLFSIAPSIVKRISARECSAQVFVLRVIHGARDLENSFLG